jgi:VanZ family protein
VPKPHVSQSDKLEHFAAYGLLMFLFCQLYRRTATRLVYAAAFIAMGVALEFLQRMTGWRTFEVLDMLANGTGVFLGWGAAAAVGALRRSA